MKTFEQFYTEALDPKWSSYTEDLPIGSRLQKGDTVLVSREPGKFSTMTPKKNQKYKEQVGTVIGRNIPAPGASARILLKLGDGNIAPFYQELLRGPFISEKAALKYSGKWDQEINPKDLIHRSKIDLPFRLQTNPLKEQKIKDIFCAHPFNFQLVIIPTTIPTTSSRVLSSSTETMLAKREVNAALFQLNEGDIYYENNKAYLTIKRYNRKNGSLVNGNDYIVSVPNVLLDVFRKSNSTNTTIPNLILNNKKPVFCTRNVSMMYAHSEEFKQYDMIDRLLKTKTIDKETLDWFVKECDLPEITIKRKLKENGIITDFQATEEEELVGAMHNF